MSTHKGTINFFLAMEISYLNQSQHRGTNKTIRFEVPLIV